MATSDAGLTDEVSAELNPTGPEPDYGPQADPIPPRPTDGAGEEEWATYVVALGLHPDEVEKHSKAELVELAERFGG